MYDQSINYQGVATSNKVLRNVYGLLALSMIPTVFGAWIGMSTGLLLGLGVVMQAVIFLAFAFGMMFLIEKNKNSAAGVPLLLFFTFGMGLFLSRLLQPVLGMQGGPGIVMTAFFGTAAIFVVMNILSTVVKKDVSGIAKTFVVGAIALLIVGIINIFLQSSVLMMVLSTIAIIIFSGFIFFSLKDVREGRENNYISATLSVYLSIYNVFSSLVSLLTGFGSND